MTISYGHIAALNTIAKRKGKPNPFLAISSADASSIQNLPGFKESGPSGKGFIMHRPSPSAERVKVLLDMANGGYFLAVLHDE